MRKPFVIHYSVLYLILINVFFSQSHDFSFIPIYSPFFTCFFFPKQNIMSAKLIIKNFPTYHVIVPSQLGIENSVIHGDFTSSKKKFKWAILIAVFVSCPLSAVPTYCSCVGYKLIGTLQMEKYTSTPQFFHLVMEPSLQQWNSTGPVCLTFCWKRGQSGRNCRPHDWPQQCSQQVLPLPPNT